MTPLERFRAGWKARPRELVLFSHNVEGVPTLGTVSAIDTLLGTTTDHIGFGCFVARRYRNGTTQDVFGFDGGGLMHREADHSWSPLRIDRDATATDRRKLYRFLREMFPEATS